MSELVDFPLVSQLSVITPDGLPSTNGQYDCVPASILAGVMYVLGIKDVTPEYSPEALKDAAYGKGYQGGTAASAYIPWCAQHGIKLSSVACVSHQDAVSRAHQFLANDVPVIFTQQDDYAPLAFRDEWTHASVFYKDARGSLTCLDPYIDKPLTYTDAEWASRLRDSTIWIAERIATTTTTTKEEEDMVQPITLATPRVSDFYEQAGSMWRCKFAYNQATRKMEPSKDGALVGNAILKYYQSFGGDALNGMTYLGLPVTPEVAVAENITAQVFERGVVLYDASHRVDGPIGAGEVYQLNLCNKLAQSILQKVFGLVDASQANKLQGELDALTATNKHISDDNALLVAHVKELTANQGASQKDAAEIARLKLLLAEVGKLSAEAEVSPAA